MLNICDLHLSEVANCKKCNLKKLFYKDKVGKMSLKISASMAKKLLQIAHGVKTGVSAYKKVKPYIGPAKKAMGYLTPSVAKYKNGKLFAVNNATQTKKKQTNSVSTQSSKQFKPWANVSTQTGRKKQKTVTRAQNVYPAVPLRENFDKYFNKKGSVKVNEFGGSLQVNGTGCAYLNHGTAAHEVIRSMYRALIKRIYARAGCDIRNWNEVPSVGNNGVAGISNLTLYVHYYNTPSANVSNRLTVIYQIPDTLTFSEIALGLEDRIRTTTTIVADELNLEFDSILCEWNLRNAVGSNSTGIPSFIIDLKEAVFNFKMRSDLRVINRTLAEPDAGDTHQDRDDNTNIDIVPLKGKVYGGNKSWRNYIELYTRATQRNTPPVDFEFNKKLVADTETGICQWTATPTSAGNAGQLLAVPPRAYVLGYKKESNVYIKPGDMSRNKWTFQTKMSFNKLVLKFASFFTLSPINYPSNQMRRDFGFIQGYALEKYLDANRSAGSNISIGYQLKQTYMCAMEIPRKTASNTILNITTTPISETSDRPSAP
jgi:hypothetical protein